mmetsp:Transcript_37441/g.115629  ORF Transcript_37441/g.115629 Transcript_37441/m.115629 type:complete len:373 (-) Transcript_37441:1063-2181(-)
MSHQPTCPGAETRCPRKSSGAICKKAHAAARVAAEAGVEPPAWARAATVRVRLPSRQGVVVVVPALRVWHVPQRSNGATPPGSPITPVTCPTDATPTLCPSCDPAARRGTPCPYGNGSACPFVHADVRGAPEYRPHEKAAAARGAYERFAPGASITIAVGGKAPVSVPSEQLLLTEAPVGIRRVVAACSHFMAKGRCDRGRGCSFAHPVLHPGTSQQQQRNAPQLQRQQQHYDQQLSPQPPPAGNASALGLENARSHDSLAAVPPASPSSSRAAVKSPSEALSRAVSSPHHGSGGDSTTPTPTSADTTNPTSAGDSAGSHPGVPSSGPRAVFFSEHRTPRDSGLVAPERRRYSHAPYDAVPIFSYASAAHCR